MLPFQTKPIRILLIEENRLTRVGIVGVLDKYPDFSVVAQTADGNDGLRLLTELKPDVTLMNLRNRFLCGLDFLQAAQENRLSTKIVFLVSDARDMEISRSLKFGAFGFILNDSSEEHLLQAIRSVNAGKNYLPSKVSEVLSDNRGREDLTPSEQRILQMLVEGTSNRKIAAQLDVTENTIRTHVKNIFEKLAVTDRTAAVTTGIRRGLVRVDF